jgi:hypothetical protein
MKLKTWKSIQNLYISKESITMKMMTPPSWVKIIIPGFIKIESQAEHWSV